jgi:hypothetical protein
VRFVLLALLVATTARADVDWARGLVTADGVGIANRAAPSPAAARGPARRMAEEAARKQLAAQLPKLPLASGGTLGAKLKGDAELRSAIERAVANALVVAAEPETDGSWRVTMGVPIEAVRMAMAGTRALGASGDDGALPVVVVESGAKPAVGYRIGGLAAAAVFVRQVPAWAAGAPRVKAKAAKAGRIDVEAPAGASEATLFVVVGSK